MTEPRIFLSLALKASFSLAAAAAPGSEAVTPTLPRETNIQPSVPSNLTPLGLSPPISMFTPLAYFDSTRKLPWTFHSPEPGSGNEPRPVISVGPVSSVFIPQWAMSMWWEPQPVIMPAPNCSSRSQPPRPPRLSCGCTRSSV